MNERYIAAIDLGSSKFSLSVAKEEGANTTVVFYGETPSQGMSRGAVFNETQAAQALGTLKTKAEEELGIVIKHAAVGLPRFDVRTLSSSAEILLPPDKAVEIEDIKSLLDMAKSNCEIADPDKYQVYDVIAQSFSDGEEFQIKEQDIIGLEREKIEGNVKVFVGRKSSIKRIGSVFNKLGVVPITFFPIQWTAKSILSKAEMENGVALVEIGAATTGVSIYTGGILRYYDAIPFAGRIITSDIMQECGIGEKLADNIKKGYGVCMSDRLQNLADKKLQIRGTSTGSDKQILVKNLSEVITARTAEIIDAALWIIQQSGLYDELKCGIVLTGGGALLGNIAPFFYEKSGLATKTGYPISNFSFACECPNIHEPAAAAAIGLLDAARSETTLNYAEEKKLTILPFEKPEPVEKSEEEPNDTLFGEGEIEEVKPLSKKELKKKKEEEEKLRKAAEKKKKEEEKKNRISWTGRIVETLFNGTDEEV